MADCIVKWCVHSALAGRFAFDRDLLMCLLTVNRQQATLISLGRTDQGPPSLP
jgi:hypothetical protein